MLELLLESTTYSAAGLMLGYLGIRLPYKALTKTSDAGPRTDP